MQLPALFTVLLAQASEAASAADQVVTDPEEGSGLKILGVLAIVLAVLIVPFVVGKFLARSLKVPEFSTRIGTVLFAITAGVLVVGYGWPPKLGVDLKGGVILTYEVDDEDADRPALIEAIGRRINPSGTKEIVIRPYGARQVEIIIPEVDTVEIRQIKKKIEQAGVLEFRIVANRRDHDYIIELAREQAESRDPAVRADRKVSDAQGSVVGRWVDVGREAKEVNGVRPVKVAGITSHILRDGATGRILDDPAMPFSTEKQEFEKWLASQGISNLQVLMAVDDGYDVTGDYLDVVSSAFDENARPSVNFQMSPRGATLFGAFTQANRPTENFQRQLGIVLDNRLESAPNLRSPISDRGQITGSFTSEEVKFLVDILRAGKLPSTLRGPTSENQVGSLLGSDTIDKGTKAIGISLVAVLFFIAIYYRFAGVIACLALLINLVLILGLLILLQQPLTLPGLAGLVLTVGMSVDANVLIFERIREELNKGAALRMAIRNGFSRATTTIVDANLTTLITAIVLYAIGTDQIKGFAVTLIIGILMSMFTAIFCSRVVFEVAERKRYISKLTMMELLGGTHIDFIGKRKLAAVASLVLIAVGIGAVAMRGKQIFDIDFLGGTSVTMMLEDTMDDDQVRENLAEVFGDLTVNGSSVQYNLSRVDVEGQPSDRFWKVNTSMEDVDKLKQLLSARFDLATYSMEFTDLEEVVTTIDDPDGTTPGDSTPGDTPPPLTIPEDTAPAPPAPPSDDTPSDDAPSDDAPSDDAPSDDAPADDAPADDAPADDAPSDDTPSDDTPSDDTPSDDTPSDAPADDAPADDAPPAPSGSAQAAPRGESFEFFTDGVMLTSLVQDDDAAADDAASSAATPAEDDGTMRLYETTAELEFGSKINYSTLKDHIEQTADALNMNVIVQLVVNDPEAALKWTQDSPTPHRQWKVTLNLDEQSADRLLTTMQENLRAEAVWHAADKIGSQVAGKTQNLAIWALLSSLLGIVAYIWVRFQKVEFGLAAVVALIHDVLITLGAIAVSYWLAGALGFLQIEEFKISLPVVAAFLTIIGYSLNDTIVVFDRIREVRGKSPDLTEAMINESINQTLGRTLLTSATTLLVVLVLYAGGGQSIHGFSFALLVGVMVGTYSSIFVASPALLWMMRRAS